MTTGVLRCPLHGDALVIDRTDGFKSWWCPTCNAGHPALAEPPEPGRWSAALARAWPKAAAPGPDRPKCSWELTCDELSDRQAPRAVTRRAGGLMPALSFRPQYVPLILRGSKDQTIRRPGREPVSPGDALTLFEVTAEGRRRNIGAAACSNVFRVYVSHRPLACGTPGRGPYSRAERDALAQRDGFTTFPELMRALRETYGRSVDQYDVIRWRDFVPAEGRA